MKNLEISNCDFCQEFQFGQGKYYFEYVEEIFDNGDRIIFSDGIWNLIPTIGGFVSGYTLLVHKHHHPSLYHCSQKDKEAFLNLVDVISRAYKSNYNSNVFIFEHGSVDTSFKSPNSVEHVHLHFLPYKQKYSYVNEVILNQHLPKYVLESIQDLNNIINTYNIKSYLLYYINETFYLVDITDRKLQSQFLRKIIYDIENELKDDGWNWREHAFVNNMYNTYTTLKPFFEQFTITQFSTRANKYESESEWIKNPNFIQPLVPVPFGKMEFLEVACGTGVICEKAHNIGWNVTAVDNCKSMLNNVENTICKVEANGESLPFDDASFDVVVCRQGLQYMNMRQAICEMIRASSSEVILLHATVFDKDIFFWQTIFNLLGYIGKQIIGSVEIQSFVKNNFSDVVMEYDKILYTKEKCLIPKKQYEKIVDLIQKNSAIADRYCIEYNVDTKELFYKLEWHLIMLKKINIKGDI